MKVGLNQGAKLRIFSNKTMLTKKGVAKIILKLIYYEKPLLFLVFSILALELIYTSCGIYKFSFSCIIRV